MVKTTKITKFLSKKIGKIWIIGLFLVLLPMLAFTAFNLVFLGKIYPGIIIAGTAASGKEPKELALHLSETFNPPEKIILTAEAKSYELLPSSFDFSYDFSESSQKAYAFDRTGNIFLDFLSRIKSLARHEDFPLIIKLDEAKLDNELAIVSDEVASSATPPSIKLAKGEIVINKGKEGKAPDTIALKRNIKENLAQARGGPIHIPIITINGVLSDTEAQELKARGEKLVGKALSLTFEYQSFTYKNNDLFPLLAPKGGYNDQAISAEIEKVTSQVNRLPKNPVFNFTDGKVQEFQPALDGISVKTEESRENILSTLKTLEETEQTSLSFDIPVARTSPEIKTEDVNNLGIKELLGRGTSHFRGSIASRIYNIKLAAGRINGALVKPGDTFSFVNTLGDVSKLTGYQQAYIIQEGRTILGDGGGVCQVSTTFFRAALAAGLPILERRAHSYRVGYYEQDSPPGFDATVYYPTTDLKVKNDTPGHILIQSYVDTKTSLLVFEIYGTQDGRVTTTTKPKISDQIEPPPDLYQDDPTLPAGTVKQIDYRAWGAKVVFSYTVTRAGETIYKKSFTSNYQPWQAVYLRGTGPAQ
jgi:vancomycin resistance protein YoaR